MHATACHRADELPPADIVPRHEGGSQILEQLVNAFRRRPDGQDRVSIDTLEKTAKKTAEKLQ
jgi:hypothetical protein